MNLLPLILLSIGMGLVGLCGFLWALRNGQFDDLDGDASRVLMADEPDEQTAMQWSQSTPTAVKQTGASSTQPEPEGRRERTVWD